MHDQRRAADEAARGARRIVRLPPCAEDQIRLGRARRRHLVDGQALVLVGRRLAPEDRLRRGLGVLALLPARHLVAVERDPPHAEIGEHLLPLRRQIEGDDVRAEMPEVLEHGDAIGQRARIIAADVGHRQRLAMLGLVQQVAGPIPVHRQIEHRAGSRIAGQRLVPGRCVGLAHGVGRRQELEDDQRDGGEGNGLAAPPRQPADQPIQPQRASMPSASMTIASKRLTERLMSMNGTTRTSHA